MISKLGPVRHFDFPDGGHHFINRWDLPTHVPGVNFTSNPSVGPTMFFNILSYWVFPVSLLLGTQCIIA